MPNKIVLRFDIGNSENFPELVLDELVTPEVDHLFLLNIVEAQLRHITQVGFAVFPDLKLIVPVSEIRRISWYFIQA